MHIFKIPNKEPLYRVGEYKAISTDCIEPNKPAPRPEIKRTINE